MFEILCNFPLPSDLFAQATHPTSPLLAIGLSTGHVETRELPITAEAGKGFLNTTWQTQRHKVSCRALTYSIDGDSLFSGGGEGIIKAADTRTGQVWGKVALMSGQDSVLDPPTVLHELTPLTLLAATDSGALHLYDLRTSSSSSTLSTRPSATYTPHLDYISSVTAIPASATSTSGFAKQFVSVGGTTLAVTDVRKGVLRTSESQDAELLACCYASGLPRKGSSVGAKVIVGQDDGVVTLWEHGVWDDQDERVVLSRFLMHGGGPKEGNGVVESVESLAMLPEELSHGQHVVMAGMGDGMIVGLGVGGKKGVVDCWKHSEENEGVIGINFDAVGRMVTGGGRMIRVWGESMIETGVEIDDEEEDEEDDEDERDSGDGGNEGILKTNGHMNGKRPVDSSEEEDEDSDSSEEEKSRKRKKKKKRKRERQNGTKKGDTSNKNHMGSFKGLD